LCINSIYCSRNPKETTASKVAPNAIAVSQLSTAKKKSRLKRLKELLAGLKRDDDISRRDLKSVLSEERVVGLLMSKPINIFLLIIQKA
jgi:hypothetical protein